ncbi:TPA: AAA family ATPase [Acinetobacter baumannii]|uniref:AAA family ATPase n=1 Tax=Acinetobacter baumannii TaxID=470 RepID=UPI0013C57AA9|nr:AAA family ATPase [Acinetobacter baumannii]NDW23756.1 AAA family ATPase [Acinetobacter baumannii]HBM1133765.1 AAA family ATPase [Acinetobacter baumannii]
MLTGVYINNVATYSVPTQLDGLKQINFIFGANGSGKSTIGRIIDQSSGYTHCLLQWLGGEPIKTLVYNKDFIDRNFNQENTVKGVFTLGDDQVEAERQIALLRPQIDKVKDEIRRLNIQLNGEASQGGKVAERAVLDPEIQAKCWKKKQKYDSYFQDAFTGFRNSAERFKDKVLLEKQINQSILLSLEELKEKASTIFSRNVERYNFIPVFNAATLIEVENNPILQRIIIGNQDVNISKLIETIGNSDWVKHGRKHFEKSYPQCPFCQQITSPSLSDELLKFFSETYEQEIGIVEQIFSQYLDTSEMVLNAIQFISSQNIPFLEIDLFQAEAQILNERLERNKGILQRKLSEPSLKVSLEPLEPIISKILGMIQDVNQKIMLHNQVVQNLSTEKQNLTNQVWKYIINELDSDLSSYLKNKTRLESTINGMNNSLKQKREILGNLEAQLKVFEKKATSTIPTVNEINDLLKSFGFTSFYISPVDEQGHYRICRANGDDASRSLSEGEKTFITFLYFYSLIKGSHSSSGITENRIVVFDDPISSLDSDILYIVSSLIKRVFDHVRTNNALIKQVFVLTHNVYFHKEITFNNRRSQNQIMGDETFWMVKKNSSGSTIEKCSENPIRSAYELLWSDIKTNNQSNLTIQNTLRRILENYFTMWGSMKKDEICDLFEGNEKLICQSLFAWVNDGSHSIHDDLYINHGQQTNESYLTVFKEIFNKSGQIGHYQMMTGSLTDSTS